MSGEVKVGYVGIGRLNYGGYRVCRVDRVGKLNSLGVVDPENGDPGSSGPWEWRTAIPAPDSE